MKSFIVFALMIVISSCSNNGNSDGTLKEGSSSQQTPSAIDTTQHATGITNSNVISTDTASMNVQKFRDKKEAAK